MIRKNKKLIITLAIALALTLAALALIIFSGGANIDYTAEFREDAYIGTRVIEGGGPVKALDIKWHCGNVYIYSYDGEDIFLYESEDTAHPLSREALIGKKQARLSLASSVDPTPLPEGVDTSLVTTVYVDYDTSALMHSGIRKIASYWLGIYAGKDSRSVARAEKDLYILLPSATPQLAAIIESDGCVIEDTVFSNYLTVLSQGGGLTLRGVEVTNTLTVSSSDGDILLSEVKCAALKHSTVSGELEITDSLCPSINASSIIGDATLERCNSKDVSFESYFGSLELKSTAPSESIYFESISGDFKSAPTVLSAIKTVTVFGKIEIE